MHLEELLLMLERFGDPVLHKMDNGWYCRLKVFVAGEGISFEVKSEFNHATPTEAAECAKSRLASAMAQIVKRPTLE